MADRAFLKKVDDACEAALVEIGFKRPRRGTIYLEIKSDFLGWVGLNVGNHGDLVRINPNIGIHCKPAEKLWRDLVADRSCPYKKGYLATYALPLGTQTPQDIDAIVFFTGASTDREARRLSMLIGEYGTPWMIEHASYGALIPLVEERFADLPNYPQRLAAMYYLAGQTEKAVKFTHDVLDSLRKRDDGMVINQFERFAVPFLQMIDPEV